MRKTIQSQSKFLKVFLPFLLLVFLLFACKAEGSSTPPSAPENEIAPTPTSTRAELDSFENQTNQVDEENVSSTATVLLVETTFDGKMREEEVEGVKCQVLRFEMENAEGTTYRIKLVISTDEFTVTEVDPESLMEYVSVFIENGKLQSVDENTPGEVLELRIIDLDLEENAVFVEGKSVKFGTLYEGEDVYNWYVGSQIHPEKFMMSFSSSVVKDANNMTAGWSEAGLKNLISMQAAGMFVVREIENGSPDVDIEQSIIQDLGLGRASVSDIMFRSTYPSEIDPEGIFQVESK